MIAGCCRVRNFIHDFTQEESCCGEILRLSPEEMDPPKRIFQANDNRIDGSLFTCEEQRILGKRDGFIKVFW